MASSGFFGMEPRPSLRLPGLHAVFSRLGVRGKTLAARELGRHFSEARGGLARDADDARSLLEVIDAERRGKTRRARSGQHVVGPGTVVAERFRAFAAKKDRACMPDL